MELRGLVFQPTRLVFNFLSQRDPFGIIPFDEGDEIAWFFQSTCEPRNMASAKSFSGKPMNRFSNDANVMISPRLNVVLTKSLNEFSNRFNDVGDDV